MREFTKAERKLLRELAGKVYEAEAHGILEELDAEFTRWRTGEIWSSDLLAAIHEFHQRRSRELWSTYQSMKESQIVARGIAMGLLDRTEVGEPLRGRLESLIDLFSRDR